MKIYKILWLLIFLLFSCSLTFAKDYTRTNINEIKHAQKFAITNKMDGDFETYNNIAITNLKDPHLLKINNIPKISPSDYAKKQKSDDEYYAKVYKEFKANKADSYSRQAYGRDFYKIYRIAERIIRANNLGFMNWRIAITANVKEFNAYSTQTNCIILNSALYDSLADNEDALALAIAHEMAHQVLGHIERKMQLNRYYSWLRVPIVNELYRHNAIFEMRRMEISADTEGAKLILKAGYNLDNAVETLEFINTLESRSTYQGIHPKATKRIQNYQQNRKYFLDEEWIELGAYNLYNSEPLTVRASSDRKSIVIGRGKSNTVGKNAYKPETIAQLYTRYAYKTYLNGEFHKSLNYFHKLFKIGTQDYAVYLYASYDCECLYKQTNNEKYIQMAKEYANKAKELAPQDKNVKKQLEDL